jgi:hypothetical protein
MKSLLLARSQDLILSPMVAVKLAPSDRIAKGFRMNSVYPGRCDLLFSRVVE